MGISTFNLYVWVFIAQLQGKGNISTSLFTSSATFCFLFLLSASLLPTAFKCYRLPCLQFLLEGVVSNNPPVRTSAFRPLDHFLIPPPPRCNIAIQHEYGTVHCSWGTDECGVPVSCYLYFSQQSIFLIAGHEFSKIIRPTKVGIQRVVSYSTF